MKTDVKIAFSPKELRYVNDTEFLLTKKEITKKVYDLFHGLSEVLKNSKEHQEFVFPNGVDFATGKISRGENYKGLPFVVLDFPRLFSNENIFAFRTMFWWGKYFSFTLHLKGHPLKTYYPSILKKWNKLKKTNYYWCITDNEWEHDLDSENYRLIKNVSADEVKRTIGDFGFIKLSRKISLSDYQKLLPAGLETYRNFLKVIG